MKHFAASAMIALLVIGLPLPGAAQVDPASVPEIKRSRLQLYLTAREAHDIYSREPARTLFLAACRTTPCKMPHRPRILRA